MCGICGCSKHEDTGSGHHQHEDVNLIRIEADLLAKNDRYALKNNQFFKENGITAVNMMSSPGSGKTTLLGQTMLDLSDELDLSVIVADQKTDFDAHVIRASGGRAHQINTGQVCHLDAHRLGHAVTDLNPAQNSVLFIENIGNLVCPALFNLGEMYNVVILSVTEGENKPIKYPDMFRRADLIVLTKIDLLPYVDFDPSRCIEYARTIKPDIPVISLSATKAKGMEHWYQWLREAILRAGAN